jgi:hypothetical protein
MIKEVTVTLQTSTEEVARRILSRTAETYADSRVFLGLAGREFRCATGERRKLLAGSIETFVFGGDTNVTSAAANDPANRTMADVRTYPVYIRFAPMPNASDADEDDWCLEHVKVGVEGTEGSRVDLIGLDGSARLYLGSDGGHFLYLQPGAAQFRQGPTIVRGSVSANGERVAGSGFTVARTGTGTFTVTFDAAFSEPPVVVATIFGPTWWLRDNAHVLEVTTGHAVIRTGDDNARPADRDFHFITTAVSESTG